MKTTPLLLALAFTPLLHAAEPGVVSHITVLSDKAADFSSVETWRKAIIKDGTLATR